MRITTFCVAAAIGWTAACSGRSGASATSVTSGTSGGARLNGAPNDADESGMRLADEICKRSEACGQIGEGARYASVEACMAEQGARAPARAAHWSCKPSVSLAGFETCLAAVRGEHCETKLATIDELEVCRSRAVCGRTVGHGREH